MQALEIGEVEVDGRAGGSRKYKVEPDGMKPIPVRFNAGAIREITASRVPTRLVDLHFMLHGPMFSTRAVHRAAQRSTSVLTAIVEGTRVSLDSPNSFSKDSMLNLIEMFLHDLERELSAPAQATTRHKVARSESRNALTTRRTPRPRRDVPPEQARR